MHTEQDTRASPADGPRPSPVRSRDRRLRARLLAGLGWLLVALVVLAGLLAAATALVDPPVPVPERTGVAGAATVTTVLSGLLAHRTGSRTLVATAFAALLCVAAVVSGWSWLLAGLVAFTAFVSAVLSVVATRPARRASGVLVEYGVAVGVALSGAVAAAAYQAPVRAMVLTEVVSLTAVAATLWLAYRLGGGFHGLGKRGGFVLVSAVVVIVAGVAYSEALRRWGSPAVVDAMSTVTRSTRDLLGALPPPLEILIGFPALVWGLATRSELRQGWWVCAFGAVATAGVATSLSDPSTDLAQSLLGTGYAVVIGLVLGLLVWRIDLALTGQNHQGRRARRADRTAPMRPEPSRARPLM